MAKAPKRIKGELSEEAILKEFAKRAEKPVFNIERYCFKEQLALIRDTSNFATACCSRRSGKTVGCAADLVDTALKRPNIVCLYVTLSRASAKRIIWPELLEINRKYELGGETNIADLSLTFPNGSVIYCSGAKNKSEIEKFRGLAIAVCYIDEAQSFGQFIEELIDDVISKALYDYDGRLRVTGTPSPIPTGYFYDICEGTKSAEWGHHHWTMLQNPWLHLKSGKTPLQLIDRDLKRKGVGADDPTIQRECYGKWVTDTNALVFRYTTQLNDYTELPDVKGQGEWTYIIGVDIGFIDSDAIAVIAFHDNLKQAYLVSEDITAKQGITELANKISLLIDLYKPMSVVMDTGGLGKKIADELGRRYSLPVKSAEKSRKAEFIELLNDAMRTEKFFAKSSSQFANDCMLVEKNREKSTGDKLVISDRFHSDICDSVLYAFRESLHFLSEPEKPAIEYGSSKWHEKEMAEMEDAARNTMEKRELDPLASIGADPIKSDEWE